MSPRRWEFIPGSRADFGVQWIRRVLGGVPRRLLATSGHRAGPRRAAG
ncbi:hypothetical protein ACIQB5_50350 [Streptomyces sp. NPDC088560]